MSTLYSLDLKGRYRVVIYLVCDSDSKMTLLSAADCTAEGHGTLESDSAANRCAILKGGFIKGQWTKEVGWMNRVSLW
jgi:hypothetical protein